MATYCTASACKCNLKLLNYKLQVECNWITNYKLQSNVINYVIELHVINYYPTLLIRPVLGGLMFYRRCFLFFSPCDLRGSSANRHETLPHDRQLTEFYNASPKIPGPSPPQKKKIEAKNMGNFSQFYSSSDFDREYLRNEARYRILERHTNESNSSCVWGRKSGDH